MKKFKLVFGRHHSGNQSYTAGDIITSETDLVARFGRKFELLSGAVPVEVPAQVEQPQKPAAPKEPTPTEPGKPPKYRSIHKGGGRYVIVDADDTPIHDDYLNKQGADDMLEGLLGEDDDA